MLAASVWRSVLNIVCTCAIGGADATFRNHRVGVASPPPSRATCENSHRLQRAKRRRPKLISRRINERLPHKSAHVARPDSTLVTQGGGMYVESQRATGPHYVDSAGWLGRLSSAFSQHARPQACDDCFALEERRRPEEGGGGGRRTPARLGPPTADDSLQRPVASIFSLDAPSSEKSQRDEGDGPQPGRPPVSSSADRKPLAGESGANYQVGVRRQGSLSLWLRLRPVPSNSPAHSPESVLHMGEGD